MHQLCWHRALGFGGLTVTLRIIVLEADLYNRSADKISRYNTMEEYL